MGTDFVVHGECLGSNREKNKAGKQLRGWVRLRTNLLM